MMQDGCTMQSNTYREILDASARSINIEKRARVMVDDKNEVGNKAA